MLIVQPLFLRGGSPRQVPDGLEAPGRGDGQRWTRTAETGASETGTANVAWVVSALSALKLIDVL